MKLILVSSSDALAAHQGLRSAAELVRADVVVRSLAEDQLEVLDSRTGVIHRADSPVCDVLVELSTQELAASIAVVALPPLTSCASLATRVQTELPASQVLSCALAVDPNWIEDQLWDTADDQHQFLNTELDFCDSVFLTSPETWSPNGPARTRGIDLLTALAPHARRITCPSHQRRICGNGSRLGRHVLKEAHNRVSSVLPACADSNRFRTIVVRQELPISADDFYARLPELAAGSVRVRGQLWLDSHLTDRLHVQGCGPHVWVENRGPWDPTQELAYTEISFTGENLEPALLTDFLQHTPLTISHSTEEGTS